MPYIYSNKTVAVEAIELVPRFWNKLGTLQKELKRYEDKPFGIKRLIVGGNGRKLLVDFDSLSSEIQDALGDPRKAEHPLQPFFEWDSEAPEYYSKFKRGGTTILKSDEQERYIINASVMQAVVKLEQARIQERLKMKLSLVGLVETLRYDVESFQIYLRSKHEVEHTLPVSIRFKELLKDFKENKFLSLIKDPSGTGKQNARKVDEKTEMILNGLFKNQLHKPTPTDIARNYDAFLNGYAEVYNEDTGEMYNPKEFKKLSQATIINYINKWENILATYKSRSGDRQVYMGKFKPPHQMDMPTMAGSIISIDDRQPPFIYNKQGDRAWFYLGVDIASQAITTVVYGKSKESILLDFYRQMVRNYTEWGYCLPNELECESSLNSAYKDTLLRNGVMFQEVKIEANNARGKYIERVNEKLRYEIEKTAMGWIARPKAKRESNQASSEKKQIIPFDILINERMLEIEQFNNSAHPDNKLISRWDYFEQNQHADLKPTNWGLILPYLGFRTTTSCNTGYVMLQGKRRAIAENGKILTGEALIQQMRVIEGKEFDVYWLDGNEGQVLKAMVYFNDRFVCELMELPRYNRAKIERTDADYEALQLQSAYVASVDLFEKRQRNKIENVQIIDNTPKTVNSNFKFKNVKRYEAREEPAEVFADDDENDDQLPYIPQQNAVPSWKRNFM